MSDILKHWDRRLEDLDTATGFAERQKEHVLLRLMGQLALPIEAALADEDGQYEN